jgi:hypothetical protein
VDARDTSAFTRVSTRYGGQRQSGKVSKMVNFRNPAPCPAS